MQSSCAQQGQGGAPAADANASSWDLEDWSDPGQSFDTEQMFDDGTDGEVRVDSLPMPTSEPGTLTLPERPDLPMHPWRPEVPSAEPIRLQDAPEGSRTFLTNLVLDNLPDDYEDAKKWGQTRQRWDGVKMRFDGLKLRTNRRWKEVNHGTWKRYHIALLDPEEHLLIKITDWKQLGIGTVAFQLNLAARVRATARRQEWNNGVRLYSVSSEAIADVGLKLRMQVSTRLDATKFPPDVVLAPVADSAEAQLVQFKLQRISHADGPIVRELGDGLEKILRRKLAEKNDKLVEKINRQIKKKEDDLRLSVSDLVKHEWLGIKPPAEVGKNR